MVGGDRRSPPRHKAKGGGGKGKGSGGNEGLYGGSVGNGKSGEVMETVWKSNEFKFGTSSLVESLKIGSDTAKQGSVKDLAARFGAAVPNLQATAAVNHDKVAADGKFVDPLGIKAKSATVGSYVNSWAAAIEQQEEQEQMLMNAIGKSNSECGAMAIPETKHVSGSEVASLAEATNSISAINSSTLPFIEDYQQHVHDSLMANTMNSVMDTSVSLQVEAQSTSIEGYRDHEAEVRRHRETVNGSSVQALECSNLQRGEDLLLSKEGKLESLQVATNSAQVPILDQHTANMDCDGMPSTPDVSMCAVNCNVNDWMSKNSGEIGGANSSDLHRNQMCTQGVRSMASIGQGAENTYVNSRFLGKTSSALNSNFITSDSYETDLNMQHRQAKMNWNSAMVLPRADHATAATDDGLNYKTTAGENGGNNCTNFQSNHKCTAGGRSIALSEQCVDNTYVNSGFLRKGNSALAATRATNSQKPNAWKRIGHHKINLQELGTITENGKAVCFDENAYERNKGRLDKGLVGKLIGRKLPLHILDQELSRRWSHVGGFRTILVGGDCFLCIFESMEARDNILMGGPWLIMGHLIGMDRWSPDFDPGSLSGLTSPVWVRMPKLPLLYWDNITIGRIAAMIGEPLWIDAQTTEWGRSEYARVCVRLDLSKKLPTGVWIQGKKAEFFQPVEYEGISLLCFHCGVVGHKAEVCCHKAMVNPSKFSPGLQETTTMKDQQMDRNSIHEVGGCSTNVQTKKKPNVENTDACDSTIFADPDEGNRYGPWILVTRKRKTLPRQRPLATNNQPPFAQMSHKSMKKASASPPLVEPVTGEPPQEPMVLESVSKSHDMEAQEKSEALAHPPTPDVSSPLHEAVMPSISLKVIPSHQPNSGKSRVSRAHFEKELRQLGPIALKSRKRKKQISVAGLHQGLKELANEEGTVQSDCGGDASPSSGK